MVVKAAAGRAPMQGRSGQGGAGEERWEEGMPRHPFIGLEGCGVALRRRGMGGGGGAP
jgi:hypothetical protein